MNFHVKSSMYITPQPCVPLQFMEDGVDGHHGKDVLNLVVKEWAKDTGHVTTLHPRYMVATVLEILWISNYVRGYSVTTHRQTVSTCVYVFVHKYVLYFTSSLI